MRAKRTDKNQAEIVKLLRRHYGQVIVTNMGDDFPDLLCGSNGGWTLLEVKQPNGCLDRGQLKFLSEAHGAVAVVTNIDEAINALWDADTLNDEQKVRIAHWLIRNPDQETLSVKKFRAVIA